MRYHILSKKAVYQYYIEQKPYVRVLYKSVETSFTTSNTYTRPIKMNMLKGDLLSPYISF